MAFKFTLPRAAASLLLGALLGGCPQLASAQRNPLKAVSGPTRQLLQKGRYAEAQVEIDQRLRQDSLNTDLLSLRAECLLNQRGDAHATAALADLNKALQLKPDTWLFLSERGFANGVLRRYPESIADYTAALRQTPAEPMLLVTRGYSYLSSNHLLEASSDFLRATSLVPSNPEYGIMLVITQMINGSYAEALKGCTALISKHKNYGLGYANRALLRQRLNDPQGARQDANEALRINAADSTTRLISAFVYQQAGETEKAQRGYDEIQAQAKDKSSLFFERGDLYLQVGNITAAEADWKQAAQLGHLEGNSRLAAGFKPRP